MCQSGGHSQFCGCSHSHKSIAKKMGHDFSDIIVNHHIAHSKSFSRQKNKLFRVPSCLVSLTTIYNFLGDPAFRERIPLVVSGVLSCQGYSVFERNSFPTSLHKVANILVRAAFRIRLNFAIVLSPKLEAILV
jgi:hypothetical protein